ncbi:hypothetical protein DFH27DRAFT_611059 [Peziza echinospora]|nr:hypothetical protein DFH27DRAFT_611059 [Peziza echinospora]
MSNSLMPFVGKIVTVITSDGRHLTGKLQGCDQTTNLVISDTIERLFQSLDSPKPSGSVSHGLYIIRGDNVAVCGLVDEEVDKGIDWSEVRAEPLGAMKRS